MRLLDSETGHFVEKNPRETNFAILSHTWRPEGEQAYHELKIVQEQYENFSPSSPPPSALLLCRRQSFHLG